MAEITTVHLNLSC